MDGWLGKATAGLTNLNEQLKEFTSEVLSETTEEQEDEHTELQMARKRVTELEQAVAGRDESLASLQSSNEFLTEQAKALERRLAETGERTSALIRARDAEILQLQGRRHRDSELEVETLESQDSGGEDEVGSPPGSPDAWEVQSLRDEVRGLKAEVQHWKTLARSSNKSEEPDQAKELETIQARFAESSSLVDSLRQELSVTLASLEAAQTETATSGAQATTEGEWDEDWKEATDSRALDEAKAETERLRAELTESQATVEALDAEHEIVLAAAVAAKTSAEERLKDQETKLTSALEEISQLSAAQEEIELRLAQQEEEVESRLVEQREEMEGRLEGDLARAREENTRLTTDLHELNSQLGLLQAARQDNDESTSEITAKLERLQCELAESEDKYQKCKASNDETLTKWNELVAKMEAMEENISKEIASNAQLKEERDAMSSEFAAKLSEKESEIRRLEAAQKRAEEEARVGAAMQEAVADDQAPDAAALALLRTRLEGVVEPALLTQLLDPESEVPTLRLVMEPGQLSPGAAGKAPSDGGSSGDSNGWDRLGEDGEPRESTGEVAGGRGLSKAQLEAQLREALAALTEKTDECERTGKALSEQTTDLQEKEDLLQQVFTELKGLEMQVFEYKEREQNLRGQLQSSTQETAAKDNTVTKLTAELSTLSTRLETLETEAKSAAAEAQEASKEAAERVAEAAEAAQERDRAEQERERAEDATKTAELERERAQAEMQKAEMAAKTAGEEREKAEVERKRAEEEKEKAAVAEAALAEAQTEHARLVQLLQDKQAEAVAYYEEAQKALERASGAESRLGEVENQAGASQTHSQTVQAQLTALTTERDDLRQSCQEMAAQLDESRRTCSALEAEVERLRAELHTSGQARNRLSAELDAERNHKVQLGSEMTTQSEAMSKTEKELNRLRAHLVSIEENYTAEAVAAEERESGLRARLSELENRVVASSTSAEESQLALSREAADLRTELTAVSHQRDTATLQLSDAQEEQEKSRKALASLQAVLQQFQRDQDSLIQAEVARFKEQLSVLHSDKSRQEAEVTRLKAEASSREAEWRSTADLRAELGRKEDSMGALEAELRQRDHQLAQIHAKAASLHREESEKVDKDILRNLFMSYFTAPNDKKSQVAELVASVLGFSPEERQKALGGSGGGSWLAFLRRSEGSTASEQSLTAQFVRFLEEASAETQPKAEGVSPPLHYASGGGARPAVPAPPRMDLPTFGADSALLASADTSDFLKSALLSQPAPEKGSQ